jgi:hypothetical protein
VGPVTKEPSRQVQGNPAQPGPKAACLSKAVQANERLDGGLLENVVEVLAPVNDAADKRRRHRTVTLEQGSERGLVTRTGLEHQHVVVELPWQTVGRVHLSK